VLNIGPAWILDDRDTSRSARRLLIKLSIRSNKIPSLLVVHGVRLSDKDAVCGGGFTDIFRGEYGEESVAVKRLRVFQGSPECQPVHQVSRLPKSCLCMKSNIAFKMLCREAILWKHLSHPNVLPFLGVDLDSFPSYMCLISPWMPNGTITKYLEDNGRQRADLDRFVRVPTFNTLKHTVTLVQISEIVLGIEYLHSEHVVHGDLRAVRLQAVAYIYLVSIVTCTQSNVLVDHNWHARIADFGLAHCSQLATATHTSRFRGSARWMAPELHDPAAFGLQMFQRTFATDVYAFALLCLEVRSSENF
jgi:serine/threonine protein kinase